MNLKRISMSVALVLALLGGVGLYVYATLPRPGASRIEVSNQVVGILAGRTYAYVVQAGEHIVLVDAGSDIQAQAIKDELATRNKTPEDVNAILLTHGHRDHFAGASAFTNARLFVAPEDHIYAAGDKQSRAPYPTVLGRLSKKPPRLRHLTDALPGQLLSFGPLAFEVIATPGHTQGSVMYLLGDVLFSGGSLLHTQNQRTGPPPWYMSEQSRKIGRSLERLEKYSFATLADGRTGAGPVALQKNAKD